MNLYFIRHGESIVDRHIKQGSRYDTNLTWAGVEQAKKLYRAGTLPSHPTHVISSPLLRARQTAVFAMGQVDENFDIRLG